MERLLLDLGAYRSEAAREGHGASADPRRYVALPSAERALASVGEAIEGARSPILVEGAGGTGKTLLLRVLAGRIRFGTRRVVFSPFLHLPPGDVARWLLHLLGRDLGPEAAADGALLDEIRRHEGGPTILLVDELQCAPEASVQRLAELARAVGPRLVLVAAGVPGPGLDAARSRLQPELRVALSSALPVCEMTQLCDALLADGALPEALRALSPEARAAVVRGAAGVPGLLLAELTRRAHEAAGVEATRRGGPELAKEGAAPLRGRAERPSARRRPTEIISVPLLDTVRGPNGPPAVRSSPVPAPRHDAEVPPTATPSGATPTPARAPEPRLAPIRARGRVRAAALGSAGARALRAGAAAMRRALAGAGERLRRAGRGSVASGRWARGEEAASRRPAQPRTPAPLPRAQPSSAPWPPRAQTPAPSPLPRADLAAATPPPPVVRAPSRRRRPAFGEAARRRAARAGHGASSAVSSGARAMLGGLSSAAASAAEAPRAVRSLLAGERGKAAAAVAVLVVGTLGAHGLARESRSRADARAAAARAGAALAAAVPEPASVGSAPVSFAADTARADAPALAAPGAAPVRVQVNARPWAYIRVDGVDVGPTPLSHVRLAPGRYRFEASFPDGRRVMRSVEITREQRFVSIQ